MNTFQYILELNLYLVIFYGFYALALRNETFFSLNRIYLVFTVLFSFLAPVLQSEWVQSLFVTEQVKHAAQPIRYIIYSADTTAIPVVTEAPLTVSDWVGYIYILGCSVAGLRLIWQFSKLIYMSGAAKSKAYSFFKKIEVDQDLKNRDTIYKHEEVHAQQWHSADVLLFEIIAIINWFNPVVYAYRKSIKSIHEYIADESASEMLPSKRDYAMLLVHNVFGVQANGLSNSFYKKSLLKRRIMMLQKTRSRKRAILKYGLSAPLFIMMIILSSATLAPIETVKAIDTRLETLSVSNDIAGSIKDLSNDIIKELPDVLAIADPIFSAPITGVVKDAEGNNLGPIKITHLRTGGIFSTAPNGAFTIPGYQANDVLLFQFPGYRDQSFSVATSKKEPKTFGPYTITMISDGTLFRPAPEAITNITKAKGSQGQPLILLDGKPLDKDAFPGFDYNTMDEKGYAELLGIKTSDIKEVTVLKSSAATAVWGSKAANDVLVITTKAGIIYKDIKPQYTLSPYGDDKLYLLDDKPISNEQAKSLDIKNIKSIKIVNGEPLMIALYGERAKNGVVKFISTNIASEEPSKALNIHTRDHQVAPMVILDGVIFENIASDFNFNHADEKDYAKALNINPSDIRDITVLKDADVLSKYGEKARGGVLIINTRKTVSGKK